MKTFVIPDLHGRYQLLDCGGHHDVRRIVGAWLDEDGELLEMIGATI